MHKREYKFESNLNMVIYRRQEPIWKVRERTLVPEVFLEIFLREKREREQRSGDNEFKEKPLGPG